MKSIQERLRIGQLLSHMGFRSVKLKCAEGIYSNARKGGRGESQKKGDRLDGDVRKEIQRIARVIVKERVA